MGGGWFRYFVVPRCFRLHSSRSRSHQPNIPTSQAEEIEVAEEVGLRAEFYSSRIAEMILERRNNPGMDKVESEVEASKVTWSELSPSVVVGDELAADNLRVFRGLQEQWPGGLFKGWNVGQWELGKKIAEGGQAELFELWRIDPDGRRVEEVPVVIKMFKEGLNLQDLQRLLPPTMLAEENTRFHGYFNAGDRCNRIDGAMLFNGRFALMMERKWGDLRKVIDGRMICNNMLGPPFTDKHSGWCMFTIAEGMGMLHAMDITHGDLKTANVLVGSPARDHRLFDPIRNGDFRCFVADYECSVGVVGTGFWRAPEILLGVKNGNVTLELFTKASDVYSYGMTCYEILTGRIPFEVEGLKANDYDRVIGGYRPNLPSQTQDWMKELLSRCWHKDPLERPTFEEIANILSRHWHHIWYNVYG